MKSHNVCKCHISIDTGFKQTEHTIFLRVTSMGIKILTTFKCIFEETESKLSVNFGNYNSQDFHKNQSPNRVWNFSFMEPQYSDKS